MIKEKETLVGALDFGSHSIKLAVGKCARHTEQEEGAWQPAVQMVYVDEEVSRGAILRGVIRNLIDTAELVHRLLSRAEEALGQRVHHVAVSISGESVQSYQCEAEQQFNELHEVTKSDLEALAEQIEPIPNKYFFETANYAQYFVNGVETLRPVGVPGHNVRALIQFFICDDFLIEQVRNVLEEKLGLSIIDFFAGPTLLGDDFLTYEQKRIGSALIDFGGETTTLALYKNGLPGLLRVLPMGSKQITDDLTYLSISPEEAERLKCDVGTVVLDLKEKRMIRVKRADLRGEQEVQYYRVNQFMEARTHEIIDNLKAMTERALGEARLPGGIVLVGGGSQLKGLDTLLSEAFGASVDYAYNRLLNNPEGGLLNSPAQLTVYSLLQHLQGKEQYLQQIADPERRTAQSAWGHSAVEQNAQGHLFEDEPVNFLVCYLDA